MSNESQSTQDTPQQRLVEGNILIMDINALPTSQNLTVEIWSELVRKQGVLFYDSTKGNKPEFKKEDTTIKMYDVADEEVMKELIEILGELPPLTEEEKVMWENRELIVDENIEPVFDIGIGTLGYGGFISGGEGNETLISTHTGPLTTPLTDIEVVQLEVEDPRGEETEQEMIDRIMLDNQPSTNATVQISTQGFNLIDDTTND